MSKVCMHWMGYLQDDEAATIHGGLPRPSPPALGGHQGGGARPWLHRRLLVDDGIRELGQLQIQYHPGRKAVPRL